MPREKHLVSVSIPATILAELITAHALMDTDRAVRPFPEDVRYMRAYHDPEVDAIIIVLEHPSFPRTPEGAHIMRVGAVVPTPRLIEQDEPMRQIGSADA